MLLLLIKFCFVYLLLTSHVSKSIESEGDVHVEQFSCYIVDDS